MKIHCSEDKTVSHNSAVMQDASGSQINNCCQSELGSLGIRCPYCVDWELLTDSSWLSVHLKLLFALVRLTQWVPSESLK
jgi:hypothetical protein